MTIKPSNMPQRGAGITSLAAVNRDHEIRLEREQAHDLLNTYLQCQARHPSNYRRHPEMEAAA